MDELKRKEIDKKRLQNLRTDLSFLRSEGYCIIDVSEDDFRIEIKGCLFDYQLLHALYITPLFWRNDEHEVPTLFLEY